MPHAHRDSHTEVLADHHRQILLALPFATVILVEDQILAANPRACALLEADLEGTALSAWTLASEQPRLAALLAAARHGTQPAAAILRFGMRGSPERRFEVRVSPWAVEARPGALVTLEDRSDVLDAFEREQRTAAHYRSLFEENTFPQCIVGLLDGAIVEANPAFLTLIGAHPADLDGIKLADLCVDSPDGGVPPAELLVMLRRGEARGPKELRILRLDGTST